MSCGGQQKGTFGHLSAEVWHVLCRDSSSIKSLVKVESMKLLQILHCCIRRWLCLWSTTGSMYKDRKVKLYRTEQFLLCRIRQWHCNYSLLLDNIPLGCLWWHQCVNKPMVKATYGKKTLYSSSILCFLLTRKPGQEPEFNTQNKASFSTGTAEWQWNT